MKALIKWALRVSAILIPVYIIFYAGLHEQPDHPDMVDLSRLVWIGFITYIIGGMLLLIN